MEVFIDFKSIDIACPGSVQTNENVVVSGSTSFRLINNTENDVVFNILVRIIDTKDHRIEESQTFQVVLANSYQDYNYNMSLNASYKIPERITTKLIVEIKGVTNFSDFVECNFDVI